MERSTWCTAQRQRKNRDLIKRTTRISWNRKRATIEDGIAAKWLTAR